MPPQTETNPLPPTPPLYTPPPSRTGLYITIVLVFILISAGAVGGWYYYANPSDTKPQDTAQDAKTDNTVPIPLKNRTSDQQTTTEKEQIIAAILKMQRVFASGNAKEIRAYLSVQITTPEEKKQLDEMSDEDLLALAEFAGMIEMTEAQLRSPEAVWQISDTEATITIKDAEGLSQSTTMKKINGKWQ